MSSPLSITGPRTDFAPEGQAILRALPAWFGLEDSLVAYVERLESLPTFAAHLDGAPVGFLALERHFPGAAEVHVMGILPEHHRGGIGRALLVQAETWLKAQGVRWLQVKTLSSSKQDEAYARTRSFYLGMGFEPLQELPTLWDEWNPCLMLVKTIA